jgi:hypothetical protein
VFSAHTSVPLLVLSVHKVLSQFLGQGGNVRGIKGGIGVEGKYSLCQVLGKVSVYCMQAWAPESDSLVLNPGLLFTGCVTLGRWLSISVI